MSLCPCGKERPYFNCCEPYILGLELPKTPEELMRSRYTAYTRQNIGYIQSTMLGEALKSFNYFEAYEWSRSVTWKSLTVHSFSELGDHGEVDFIARYEHNGQLFGLKEHSIFRKENNRWYYVDGRVSSLGT